MLRGLVRTLNRSKITFISEFRVLFPFKIIFAAGVYGGVYASQNYNVSEK